MLFLGFYERLSVLFLDNDLFGSVVRLKGVVARADESTADLGSQIRYNISIVIADGVDGKQVQMVWVVDVRVLFVTC